MKVLIAMKWRGLFILFILSLSNISSASKRRPNRPKGRPGPRRKSTPLKVRKAIDTSALSEKSESDESTSISNKGNKKSAFRPKNMLKLFKEPVVKLAVGLVAVGLIGIRVRKLIAEKSSGQIKIEEKAIKNKSSLDPLSSFTDLFAIESKNAILGCTSSNDALEGAETWANESGNGYTILLFDIDNSLSDSTDLKARIDYFKLMGNLTSAATEKNIVPLQTLYVPGKGNKNLFENQETFEMIGKGSWKYLSSRKGSRGQDIAAALRRKYGVNGEELRIVVLGPKHEVITENGLDSLRVDPYGIPWKPEPLAGLLTRGGFHGGHGANVSSEVSLAGKYTAVYFSASWCQPCKKFTPQLVEAYHAAMADGKKDELEVLFVSLDSEEGSFEKYRASMPWPAVGFKDKRRALLQLGLEIKSIPALVVLDPTGNVVTSSGVTDIAMNKTLENVISSKIEAADLGNSIEILQRHPVCIAICDDNDQTKAKEVMDGVARSSALPVMVPRGPRENLVYCVLSRSSKMAEAIKALCRIGASSEGSTDLVVLDLVKELYGHVNVPVATKESIKEFSSLYKSYSLAMKTVDTDASASTQ